MATGNHFIFDGLAELREELRNLPKELTAEASHIVQGAANGAEADIKGAYAVGPTGNLRDGVFSKVESMGEFAAAVKVVSSAPHAWMYENGTSARHYYTKNGVKHLTGAMRPQHTFIPRMIRARKAMYEQLADLLERHGLKVSGEA